jgi:hypothetical protein
MHVGRRPTSRPARAIRRSFAAGLARPLSLQRNRCVIEVECRRDDAGGARVLPISALRRERVLSLPFRATGERVSSGPQIVDESVGRAPGGRRIHAFAAVVGAFLRAHAILLSVAALIVLAYALAGFFLVPRLVRGQLEDYAANLDKQVTVGEIRFNPFALDASVAGLRLTEPDGSLLVGFRHFYLDASLASIWHRAVVLDTVDLSAPDVQLVIRRDGSVNLKTLVPASTEDEASNEPPPKVRIGHLSVRDGRVGVEDRTRARPFTAAMRPIRFTLTDFRTDLDFRNAYRFSGVTTDGEQLEWSGAFTVQPLGSTGEFRVQNLKLATIDSYLYESLPFRLADGHALLNGNYNFALEPLALDVNLPSVAVRDLALAERSADAAAPVRIPELDLTSIAFSLGQSALAVKSLDVRGAKIDVVREQDGSLNLSRLFASNTSAPPATEPASASAAQEPAAGSQWQLQVDTLRIEQGFVQAEDRSVTPAARFVISPANVTVEGWRNDPTAALRIDADLGINEGGKVAASGTVRLEPLGATVKIDSSSLDLLAVQPYVSQYSGLRLRSGKLSTKGEITYSAEPASAPPLTFSGDVEVADLRTTDPASQDFIKWRNLAISGIRFERHPDRLSIDRILARQPYVRAVIAQDATLNIAEVLQPEQPASTQASQAPKSAPEAKDSQSMAMRIRTVDVVDGSANFADYSIQPSFATGILELNGRVTGLSSVPSSRAKVALQGKVDKYAPVDITGEVNLLAAAKYTDLAMNFRNMELTTFNPYSGKFAGYNIARGKLSTELKYKVEDRKLAAEHHIVVDNLEFGAKTDSKDAAPIPLKLAVALLKDRNGVIDVNLPVSGTLDDPKFRLGPIIWKAILGLLTKVATAPFAALGALFGGGDELAYVDFPAGSAELAASETEKLTKLSNALVERPQLKLNVPLTAVGADDSKAMAHAALVAKLPRDLPTDSTDEASARQRLKALEAVYRAQFKAAPEYAAPPEGQEQTPAAQIAWLEEALLAELRPDAAALDDLARRRARAVQDALLANTGLSPERVFITNEVGGIRNDSGAVRMEMKLE